MQEKIIVPCISQLLNFINFFSLSSQWGVPRTGGGVGYQRWYLHNECRYVAYFIHVVEDPVVPRQETTVVEVVVLDARERQAVLVDSIATLRRGRWNGVERGRGVLPLSPRLSCPEDRGWGVNLDVLQKAGDIGRQWGFTAGCIQSVYARAGDARSNRK